MTCQEYELRLADGEFGAAVEDHLLECAECRALAKELRENAVALAAMREEALPILRPQVRRRSRIWIPAAAAAALVLLALGLPRHRDRTPAPQPIAPVAASSPAPTPVAPAPAAAFVARKRPYRAATVRERFAPKPAQPEETFMVKMLTPDPDVVVYWIVEPKEKAE
jgi:hypothetical protein